MTSSFEVRLLTWLWSCTRSCGMQRGTGGGDGCVTWGLRIEGRVRCAATSGYEEGKKRRGVAEMHDQV